MLSLMDICGFICNVTYILFVEHVLGFIVCFSGPNVDKMPHHKNKKTQVYLYMRYISCDPIIYQINAYIHTFIIANPLRKYSLFDVLSIKSFSHGLYSYILFHTLQVSTFS